MIDWISADIPFPLHEPITGDRVLCISPEGEQRYERVQSFQLRGSHESTILVKTLQLQNSVPGAAGYAVLSLDGNPVKFLQGHNLWGTDDIQGLVGSLADRLCSLLGLEASAAIRQMWWRGEFSLRRVDCTRNLSLGHEQKVLTFLRALESGARLARRGRGEMYKDGTVYFGKGSRRSSLKAYAKAQELRRHKIPGTLPVDSLLSYADDILRFEATFRGMELERLGLRSGTNWTEQTPDELIERMMRGLTMTQTPTNEEQFIAELPDNLKAIYIAWKSGADIRTMYTKPTFYRLRSKLLKHGVDISIKQPNDYENVTPLVQVIEMRPAQVPEWAEGTDLYFEPPACPPGLQAA